MYKSTSSCTLELLIGLLKYWQCSLGQKAGHTPTGTSCKRFLSLSLSLTHFESECKQTNMEKLKFGLVSEVNIEVEKKDTKQVEKMEKKEAEKEDKKEENDDDNKTRSPIIRRTKKRTAKDGTKNKKTTNNNEDTTDDEIIPASPQKVKIRLFTKNKDMKNNNNNKEDSTDDDIIPPSPQKVKVRMMTKKYTNYSNIQWCSCGDAQDMDCKYHNYIQEHDS